MRRAPTKQALYHASHHLAFAKAVEGSEKVDVKAAHQARSDLEMEKLCGELAALMVEEYCLDGLWYRGVLIALIANAFMAAKVEGDPTDANYSTHCDTLAELVVGGAEADGYYSALTDLLAKGLKVTHPSDLDDMGLPMRYDPNVIISGVQA